MWNVAVFGNDQYSDLPKLTGAANDARLFSSTVLNARLCNSPRVNLDTDRKAMLDEVDKFIDEFSDGERNMWYFAGHGRVPEDSRNLLNLVPSDSQRMDDDAPVRHIVDEIEKKRKNTINVFFFDCCREEVLTRGARQRLKRNFGGFSKPTGNEFLFSFACADGKEIEDAPKKGQDPHGFYTECLAQLILRSEVSLLSLVAEVGKLVKERSSGKQVPWYHTSLTTDVLLHAPMSPTMSIPRVVVLGGTGTGKSMLCTALFGLPLDNKSFVVGHDASSTTLDSFPKQGRWLGRPDEEEGVLIDTPGFFDSEGRDAANASRVVNVLRAVRFVNSMLLVFNSRHPRLDKQIQDMLAVFEKSFGPGFWNHVILIFTNWAMDERTQRRRQINEDGISNQWNELLSAQFPAVKELMDASRPLPCFCIDSDAALDPECAAHERATAVQELSRISIVARSMPQFRTHLITGTILAPKIKQYTSWSQTMYSGRVIEAMIPVLVDPCVSIAQWRSEPELPNGLSIDSETGWITGTPTYTSARQEVTIYVRNDAGDDYIKLELSVTFAPDTINRAVARSQKLYTENISRILKLPCSDTMLHDAHELALKAGLSALTSALRGPECTAVQNAKEDFHRYACQKKDAKIAENTLQKLSSEVHVRSSTQTYFEDKSKLMKEIIKIMGSKDGSDPESSQVRLQDLQQQLETHERQVPVEPQEISTLDGSAAARTSRGGELDPALASALAELSLDHFESKLRSEMVNFEIFMTLSSMELAELGFSSLEVDRIRNRFGSSLRATEEFEGETENPGFLVKELDDLGVATEKFEQHGVNMKEVLTMPEQELTKFLNRLGDRKKFMSWKQKRLNGKRVSLDYIHLNAVVRRGSDWCYDNDNGASQDRRGPGKLIGWKTLEDVEVGEAPHHPGWARVQWLCNMHRRNYRVGHAGKYDLAFASADEEDLSKVDCLTEAHLRPTFGYLCGSQYPHFSWFDTRPQVCMRIGNFRHGQVVSDDEGHTAVCIGVRPTEGKRRTPKLFFHLKESPGAGIFPDLSKLKVIGEQALTSMSATDCEAHSDDEIDNDELQHVKDNLKPTFPFPIKSTLVLEFDIRDEMCLKFGLGCTHGDDLLDMETGERMICVGVSCCEVAGTEPRLWFASKLDGGAAIPVGMHKNLGRFQRRGKVALVAAASDSEALTAGTLQGIGEKLLLNFDFPAGRKGTTVIRKFDVQDDICIQLSGFCSGDALRLASHWVVLIGVRPKLAVGDDPPEVWFYMDGDDGAGVIGGIPVHLMRSIFARLATKCGRVDLVDLRSRLAEKKKNKKHEGQEVDSDSDSDSDESANAVLASMLAGRLDQIRTMDQSVPSLVQRAFWPQVLSTHLHQHPLTRMACMRKPNIVCDVCHARVVAKGQISYRCARGCDWDMCEGCAKSSALNCFWKTIIKYSAASALFFFLLRRLRGLRRTQLQ